MHVLKNVVRLCCAALLISSCNNIDFKKTKGGMPYKLYASKSGTKAKPGDYLKVQEVIKVKDSVVFSTYTTMPRYYPVDASGGQPYDVSELFTELKEGDSVYAEQAMDTFIKHNPMITQQTPFRNGDKLIHTLKVIKVFANAQEAQADDQKEQTAFFDRDPKIQTQLKADTKQITDYLAKNNISAQKVGKGTYVQVITPGDGPAIKTGDYVMIKYRGSTLAGNEFDSNMDSARGKSTEPMAYQIGVQQVIKGFEEGIYTLKKGSKARLFIPSILGYGAQPPTPAIQPNENLVFDIVVLDVTNTPPTPKMMPQMQNIDTSATNK